VLKVEDPKYPHAFEVQIPERVYHFYGSSEEESSAWVESLKSLKVSEAVKGDSLAIVKSGFLKKQGGNFKVAFKIYR